MTTTRSALYVGHVVHVRARPVRHRLRQRLLAMLIDLDELPGLSARLRFFSLARWNLFSLAPRDHLRGDGALAPQIAAALAEAGIVIENPRVRLLCMPRVLGLAFNPLSVFFCHDGGDRLQAILYEVNNTFGQRHFYVLPVVDPDAPTIRQECDKNFYVSPFLAMDLHYRFRVRVPDETATIGIEVSDRQGPILFAALSARRHALTDANLLRLWLRHPLPIVAVLGGIHLEALKLWRKGLRLTPRPVAPLTGKHATEEPEAA